MARPTLMAGGKVAFLADVTEPADAVPPDSACADIVDRFTDVSDADGQTGRASGFAVAAATDVFGAAPAGCTGTDVRFGFGAAAAAGPIGNAIDVTMLAVIKTGTTHASRRIRRRFIEKSSTRSQLFEAGRAAAMPARPARTQGRDPEWRTV